MAMIHVTHLFEDVTGGRRLINVPITASVHLSPYQDAVGRYYALPTDPADPAIRSRPASEMTGADGSGSISIPWAEGTVYRISAPSYMPDVFVFCDTITMPPDGEDLTIRARDLLVSPGAETPVEWVTLASVIASIPGHAATAVEEYMAAHPGGGGGVSDHGLLTGLNDDDHPQYLTVSRGDLRYPTWAAVYDRGETDAAITAQVASIINSSPAALDTLYELAAALGNDPDFAGTIAAQIGAKANSADVATALAGKSDSEHTHEASDIASGTIAAARLPIGTGPSTVAAGDDARIVNAVTSAALDAAVAARVPQGAGATGVFWGVFADEGDAPTPTGAGPHWIIVAEAL